MYMITENVKTTYNTGPGFIKGHSYHQVITKPFHNDVLSPKLCDI